MVAKGAIQPNHIPVNKFRLDILGQPSILFVTISGLEDETEKIILPDRTVASLGNTPAKVFTATIFEHHTIELAFLRVWIQEGKHPVTKFYKKPGVLTKGNVAGKAISIRTMIGMWPFLEKDADLNLANKGDPAMVTFTFSYDKVI